MGYVWKHIIRKPLVALAVLCFGAVIALSLCGLKKAQADALVQYQEVFRNVKADCRVTNLTGSQSDNLQIFPALYSRFLDANGPLGALVEDVQIKGTTDITWNGGDIHPGGTDLHPGGREPAAGKRLHHFLESGAWRGNFLRG